MRIYELKSFNSKMVNQQHKLKIHKQLLEMLITRFQLKMLIIKGFILIHIFLSKNRLTKTFISLQLVLKLQILIYFTIKNKSSVMELDFIELQHRQNVLKLMQICGIEMKQAYELYTSCGYNFQAAVNRKFNPIPVVPVQQPVPYVPEIQYQANQMNEMGYFDDDIQYSQYKQFRKNGKLFDKKYPVRSSQSFLKSIIPKFFRSNDQEEVFKRTLQKFIDKRVSLKPVDGNLSEAFHWGYKQKFPLAVIILNFEPPSKQEVKRIFCDDLFVQKTLSQQFYPYGLNSKQYVLQDQLKNFFNFQRDSNCIIICRVTFMDQIEVVSRIKLSEGLDEVKKKIKLAKSSCIQNQMDESHIIRQYTEERRGNFNYQRPRAIKQNIKLRQDKKIRKQQEQQFFKACQPKPQEKKEEIKPEIKKEVEKPSQQKKEIVPPKQTVPTISIQQVTKIRQQKLSTLPKYNSGFRFKLRVPSGQNIIVQVDPQQKIQYIFDYINLQPEDLGFNNEIERNFDIFMGFGGSQTLKGKESAKIKQIFQDSQVLIVRQIGD